MFPPFKKPLDAVIIGPIKVGHVRRNISSVRKRRGQCLEWNEDIRTKY